MADRIERVLVTGGAGFIGSEVVRVLLDKDAEVTVYDNFSFGSRRNLPRHERLRVIEGDITDQATLDAALTEQRPQAVIHLAALHFIPYCNAHPAETVHVNVEGTEQVLQACRVGTVESLVFASTAAVYGVNGVPHTEEDSPDPLDIYGMSKFFGEELVRLYHRETQVRCGIARLFNGYGPRETNPHVIPAIAEQLRHGRRLALGNTKPRRDFVHTRDIARAVWAMAVEGEGGCEVFNVGTGRSVSVDDLIQVFSDLLGQPIDLMTDPDRVRTVERMDLVGDVQKLDRHYGWKAQVDLREGLAELLEEYGVRS